MSDSNEHLLYLCGGEIDEGEFYVSIWSESLNPATLTELLGVQPTESYRRGEFSKNGKIQYKHGSWMYSTGRRSFRQGKSCEESFDDFMRNFPGDAEVWSQILAEYDAKVSIVLWMKTWNREFDLSAFALNELGRRNLSVHIDTYLDSEEET